MQLKQHSGSGRRTVLAKIANVLSYVLVSLFFIIVLAVILIQTTPVQNFARGKIETYLQKKLQTSVTIGELRVRFPNSVLLKNVYIEDQTKDTLFSGGRLKVDLDMFKLLSNEISIKNIDLENITAKIKRVNTDTVFNFQFIVNAFMSKQKTGIIDTTALKMNIDNLNINNARIIYRDIITGDDMDLFITHLDAPIKTFDPSHLIFDIPTFTLTGLRGYYYQNEPLKPKIDSALAKAIANPVNYLQIRNKEILLRDINVDYKSVPTNIFTALKIKSLVGHPDEFNIKQGRFAFKDISLDTADVSIVMSEKQKVAVTKNQLLAKESLPVFTITSNIISVTQSNFKLNNSSLPVIKNGMDYGRLDITELNLKADNFLYNFDSTGGIIKSASLKEKSGFILNELNADFLYTLKETSITNLFLKTPGSTLKRDLIISYPTAGKLAGQLVLNINVEEGRVQVKDILIFAPLLRTLPAFANPSQTWYVDGNMYGPVSDLHFNNVTFKGLTNTEFLVSGSIKGLPDPKKFGTDLTFNYLKTGRRDIESLLPKNTLPANFTLPESISAVGRINADQNNIESNITISTSLGTARLNGSLKNFANPKAATYNYVVNAKAIQLGTLLKDPKTYGTLSGNFIVKGKGFEPQTANATVNGTITSVGYNQYTYKNVNVKGSIANGAYQLNAAIKDPNIDLTLNANGAFNGVYPSVYFVADIDSIKTKALNLTPQTIFYHGKIEGNITSTNPDALAGNILVTNSVLVNGSERVQVDSLRIFADNSNNQQIIRLQSPFMFAEINGKYKLTQLADIFQQSIDPYFSLSKTKNTNRVDAHDFTINATIFDNPALRAFVPELTKLDSVKIVASISTQNGLNGSVIAPAIIYGPNVISGLNITAATKNNQLQVNALMNQYRNGKLIIYPTTVAAAIANNVINFALNLKDVNSKNKYTLSAELRQPTLNNYSFRIKPDSLLLNYEPWTVNADNKIELLNGDIFARNFILNKGAQELSINSIGATANSPVSIDFKNFSIATLSAFVQSDSLLVNGLVNGNVLLKNYKTQPTFTSDLTIKDLSIYKDTLGNVTAQINNTTANVFNANVVLTGRGNDVKANGVYNVKPGNKSSFDFALDIAKLQLKSLEGPSLGALRNASGDITGKITLKGTIEDPELLGKINFENAAFNLGIVNSYFTIDNESLTIDNNGFDFNTFIIKDSAGNALELDGRVNTTDFSNYAFDLKLNADNFQALNTTKQDNKIYYGKMFLTTALNIGGTNINPVVEGSITVNDQTNFTVVLPQQQTGVVEREGIVRFVDMDATPQDSLFLLPYDSLNISRLTGFDISTNITIDRNAELNLVIDEGNGDFINMKGEGLLNAGIDPSGKITLVGSYQLDEGSYVLSFNFLKRKFDIQKGSRILWTGEPTNANIDISAVYIANTSPLDLVQSQLNVNNAIRNTYRQRLPFQVWLNLRGELLRPAVTFDIRLPEDKNYIVDKSIIEVVQNKLLQIREEPGEINKQVFALLLLNRFVNENPFANSNGGLDPAEFARQSVSKLLTEQLNNLAGGIIAGVDINFDLTTAADYTTGEKRNRTDFTVGLTKQLLGERLTVTVGSNFELEGPRPTNGKAGGNNIAGNVAIDYKLSRDGRYVLRVYRKNQYEGVLEGYIVETGVGFIINVDYDHFKELLQRSKSKKSVKIPVTTPAADKMKDTELKPEVRAK